MACLVPLYCCSLLIGRRLKCCRCTILQIDGMEGESEGGGGGKQREGGGEGIMPRREGGTND